MSDQPENDQNALRNVSAGRDIHIDNIIQTINQQPIEKLSKEECLQRNTLLFKVKKIWIEGLLKNSMHTIAIIEPSLENVSDLVTLSNEDYLVPDRKRLQALWYKVYSEFLNASFSKNE